jgi:hypothetical protein
MELKVLSSESMLSLRYGLVLTTCNAINSSLPRNPYKTKHQKTRKQKQLLILLLYGYPTLAIKNSMKIIIY